MPETPAETPPETAIDAEALAAAAAGPVGPQIPPGSEMVNGHICMRDAKGRLVPLELVRAQDLLQDEIVRRLTARARVLTRELADFRAECFEQVAIFNDLLADQYGAKRGGGKGNQTIATFDGLERVQVQVADLFTFGPELQAAKSLIDECLSEWTADSGPNLRAVVEYAFQIDKEGQINRGRLLGLRRMDVADERWIRGMKAIADSIRVTGSKAYVRFHERKTCTAGWTGISLDAATA